MSDGCKGRAGPPGPPQGIGECPTASRYGGPGGPALPKRRKLPHGIPDWVADGAIYFITICCAPRGENQLCVPSMAEQVLEAARFREERLDWHVRLMLLMPDHLHALVSFSPRQPMAKTLGNFKEIVAKEAGVSWQRDFFDHRLRAEESLDEKAHYIRMNPVRKGLIGRAEDWPYVWPRFANSNPAGPAVPPNL